ncbi:SulP family inorganic anion transporter [Plantactinospora sp. WMMB334]|uniref:SulP family inorganic anion transporter n=1 Tax=Plantactinospora sp. WMMB334 TaxID=3404119 RepID=UPI003B926929
MRFTGLLPGRADLAAVRRNPRADLLAGLTVAVVALPLALGFGVASGLGATAGLVTAIVAGALAAVFGGSNLQVSGPTGAMTVVLVPIIARYGPAGVLTVGFLAGLILLGLALVRAGRYARLVPAPVVEGFTAGIAVIILLQQVPPALGQQSHAEQVLPATWRAVAAFADAPHWPSVVFSLGVAAVVLILLRWRPQLPAALLAVVAATTAAQLWDVDLARIGALPATLPAPSLAFLRLDAVAPLLTSAVAVAALAALESLLSATVADGMRRGERHDPDRELFGQGIANLVTPLFGGVPATAAIARTAVNVRAGAVSRLAALTHALVLAVIMFAAAPLVAGIPLAALAGVLLATAVRMVHVGTLRAMAGASRSDALVLVLTAGATVLLDLVAAVLLGLIVAGGLALRKVANSMRVDQIPHDEHLPHLAVYRPSGPLFFAAAHRLRRELARIEGVDVVLLRLSRVTAIDASGALALREAVEDLHHRNIVVHASGVRAEHRRALASLGVLALLHERVHVDAPTAIAALRTPAAPPRYGHHPREGEPVGAAGAADAADPADPAGDVSP